MRNEHQHHIQKTFFFIFKNSLYLKQFFWKSFNSYSSRYHSVRNVIIDFFLKKIFFSNFKAKIFVEAYVENINNSSFSTVRTNCSYIFTQWRDSFSRKWWSNIVLTIHYAIGLGYIVFKWSYNDGNQYRYWTVQWMLSCWRPFLLFRRLPLTRTFPYTKKKRNFVWIVRNHWHIPSLTPKFGRLLLDEIWNIQVRTEYFSTGLIASSRPFVFVNSKNNQPILSLKSNRNCVVSSSTKMIQARQVIPELWTIFWRNYCVNIWVTLRN